MSVQTEKGILRLNGISSEQILSLLCNKHTKDTFVPECKNGETWGARDLLKIDAWVLRRTYSPLTVIGYEIKTNRQDFEQDQKWIGYLDLCHEFYFVCPAGLIRATDLPSSVGIIWASPTRLHTKRKAERHEPDIQKLSRLLIYVLMSRTKIVADMLGTHKDEQPFDRLQYVRDMVTDAEKRKELASFVKGHVQKFYQETGEIARNLKWREDTIKRFEERLALLGITWNSESNYWADNMKVESEIGLLKQQIDINTLRNIKRLGTQLLEVVELIGKYHDERIIPSS